MICAGIDAGSRTVKAVLLDGNTLEIVASGVIDQGVEQAALVRKLFEQVLRNGGIGKDQVSSVVATGYGRHGVTFADKVVTEITCHACGVRHFVPDVRTVIDIGGQDSKVICLDESGAVRDFAMNDRCAAGTGCFLEVVASRLETTLHELGEAAGLSSKPSVISSMCVVFAETEIIGLLAGGAAPEDIAAGVQTAIAGRVSSMAGRALESPVVFTGGVAMVPGMSTALQSVLGCQVTTAPNPQLTGALGAAIVGARQS